MDVPEGLTGSFVTSRCFPCRHGKQPPAAGFTLLEVIIALSILAVSLTVTMQLISGGFTNLSRVSQYFMAGNYAQNIMNELLVNPEVLPGYSMNGSFDEGYRWLATASERDMPPDPQYLNQMAAGQDQSQLFPLRLLDLQVVIQWKYRQREHQYVLRSAKVVNPLRLPGGGGLGSGLSTPGQLRTGNPPSMGLFGPGGRNASGGRGGLRSGNYRRGYEEP
jgi:prepilin-type N-terminal cleavage/methylation domain-containing protein